ncbi:MAG: nucleotidyltransferase domain-containing protein [Synechococcales bacterium]|nr:nucleotidyltransferase domain-containing protein [Synechococcales bacterium]
MEEVDFLNPKIRHLLKAFRDELETVYGERLAHLVLYGSFARQEETEGSDVDVLVVLAGDVSQADEIWQMGKAKTMLLLIYEELISVVPMSLKDFLYRDSPLLQNVRSEGILV